MVGAPTDYSHNVPFPSEKERQAHNDDNDEDNWDSYHSFLDRYSVEPTPGSLRYTLQLRVEQYIEVQSAELEIGQGLYIYIHHSTDIFLFQVYFMHLFHMVDSKCHWLLYFRLWGAGIYTCFWRCFRSTWVYRRCNKEGNRAQSTSSRYWCHPKQDGPSTATYLEIHHRFLRVSLWLVRRPSLLNNLLISPYAHIQCGGTWTITVPSI